MAGPIKTHFPRSGGQQWVDSFYRFLEPVGNVIYVSSTASTSSATGPGYSPETAFTSVALALASGSVVASNGDTVVVMPGHVETIIGAAGVALSKIGVAIIGMGVGRQRPIFNYTTAAAASLDVTAAKCSITNCVFTMIGVDAVTAGINVSGADFVFADNEVEFADGTNQATLALLTAATASRMQILRNYFHGSANAGTAACIRHVAGDGVRIDGDRVYVGDELVGVGVRQTHESVSADMEVARQRLRRTAGRARGP